MEKTENPTTTTDAAAAPTEDMNITSGRQADNRQVQNFLLVWLDASIDESKSEDSISTISKLREVINSVHTFTSPDECVNFINGINEEKALLISSGAFGQTIVPMVHDKLQVSAIYIFCGDKSRHLQWTQQWAKVKGVFTDIKPICEALEKDVQPCDQNSISIRFVASSGDSASENLNQLDPSFMYTQILKEILLTINFKESHITEFADFCREQLKDNKTELKNIEKLEREYHDHTPIWWYTEATFLYSMLNRALRTMKVNIIIKLGFFLCDIHRQITKLHAEQFVGQHHSGSFTVYRGQGLSQTDFDNLIKTKGGLLSFNNFLSTQKDREVSLMFAEANEPMPDCVGVLFAMQIDPSISSTPFASIRDISSYSDEEEILFSMHSVFRIGEIKQINEKNRLWQVELSLTSDTDPQLDELTKSIRSETLPDENAWYRLGELSIKLGQVDVAQELCESLFEQTTSDGERANIYNLIGQVEDRKGEYKKAITFYEKALLIQQRTLPSSHPNLGISTNNIGSMYEKMGEYSKALSYHERALEIHQKTLPPNHPDLAISYNNIGLVYGKMGEHSKALCYDEKALEIQQKTLPSNHPDLAITYNNISLVYEKMGEHSKALSFCERALNIGQRTLPPNHPDLQKYKKDIDSLKTKM